MTINNKGKTTLQSLKNKKNFKIHDIDLIDFKLNREYWESQPIQ